MAFCVIEGIDGSGKTSLIENLQDRLQAKGLSPCLTREPGGTPIGEKIRQILLEKSSDPPEPLTETLLYYSDRAQHIQTVLKPALQAGRWVLSDRYWASTLAFQCGGRGLDASLFTRLNELVCASLQPDIWLLLDLPVEQALKRLSRLKSLDRFEVETQDFHQRVRDYYLKLSRESKNWLVLDASLSPEKVAETAWRHIEERGLLKT